MLRCDLGRTIESEKQMAPVKNAPAAEGKVRRPAEGMEV